MEQLELFAEENAAKQPAQPESDESAEALSECAFCRKRRGVMLTIGQYTYCSALHRSMHIYGAAFS